ncbi:hypothetical protein R3P38DRAFT_3246532 [Favolaschia claudopus]|uniref:Uncharacterized protein n=1 Tax=Favolaschia claudopus TaxID=2862362 RepID=A0AAV9YYP2_9AGAR
MTDEEDIPWTRQLLLLQSNASSKRKKVALCSMRETPYKSADEEDNDSSVSGSSDSEAGSRAESLVSFLLEAKADSLRVLSYTGDIDDDLPEGPGLRARIRVRRAVSPDYRNRDTHVDPEVLERSATRLLARFKLRFSDVRLLLTAARCAIVGPSIISLARPDLAMSPSELDIVTGRGKAPAVADFFILAACYRVVKVPDDSDYDEVEGIGFGPVWSLALGDNLKINIIESITDEPLDAVVRFHFTCVVAAWHADGIWLAYPELLKEALVITTPAAYPIESGFARRFSVWSAFRKRELSCNAAVLDDAGCRFFAFPEWRYTGESGLPDPTCWTMGGSGCSEGILRRDGAPVNLVVCADRTAWLEAAEAYLSSDVGPMPFGGAPDYIIKRLTSDCFASQRDADKPVEDPQDADTDFHGKPDCFNELPGETVTEILLHLFACLHIKTVLFKADRSKHCEICVRGRRSIHADTGSRTTPMSVSTRVS